MIIYIKILSSIFFGNAFQDVEKFFAFFELGSLPKRGRKGVHDFASRLLEACCWIYAPFCEASCVAAVRLDIPETRDAG